MNQTNYQPTAKAHIGLTVQNVDASLRFYRALFGAEPYKVHQGYAKFDLSAPMLNLSLNQKSGLEQSKSPTHYGIQVQDSKDVQAMTRRLEEAGLAPRVQDEIACCHAVQDKVWAQDPDGHEWEVFVVLSDIKDSICCAPECCTS
jgi:catechol 2,3-dioxygenase-like lactoylglutathione lyase family enzyme